MLTSRAFLGAFGLLAAPRGVEAFQAIVWKHKLKENLQMCWQATEGVLTRYSPDAVAFMKRLSLGDIEADYRAYIRAKTQAAQRAK